MKMKTKQTLTLISSLLLNCASIYGQEPPPPAPKYVKETTDVETFPDEEATYKGGLAEMQKYIQENLQYPEEAIDKGIQGKIYISFIVNKKGSISDVKIERGAEPLLNEEAKRIINSMPKWEPATKNGKRVNSKVMLPIVFKLT